MRTFSLIAVIVVLWACDSVRPPTSPSSTSSPSVSPSPSPIPTPSPSPSPSPFPSFPGGANALFLAAPSSAPNFTPGSIVGRYKLEIVIGSDSTASCQSVPDYAKRRTYTADVHDVPAGYAVRLYDSTFLADGPRVAYGCADSRLPTTGACNQFLMTSTGGATLSVTMTPLDEWRGNEIWEVLLQETRLLALNGTATAKIGDGRIDAEGDGGLWWGNGLPASSYAGCRGNLQLTFTR